VKCGIIDGIWMDYIKLHHGLSAHMPRALDQKGAQTSYGAPGGPLYRTVQGYNPSLVWILDSDWLEGVHWNHLGSSKSFYSPFCINLLLSFKHTHTPHSHTEIALHRHTKSFRSTELVVNAALWLASWINTLYYLARKWW